jgi:hypothetical protein
VLQDDNHELAIYANDRIKPPCTVN